MKMVFAVEAGGSLLGLHPALLPVPVTPLGLLGLYFLIDRVMVTGQHRNGEKDAACDTHIPCWSA